MPSRLLSLWERRTPQASGEGEARADLTGYSLTLPSPSGRGFFSVYARAATAGRSIGAPVETEAEASTHS